MRLFNIYLNHDYMSETKNFLVSERIYAEFICWSVDNFTSVLRKKNPCVGKNDVLSFTQSIFRTRGRFLRSNYDRFWFTLRTHGGQIHF